MKINETKGRIAQLFKCSTNWNENEKKEKEKEKQKKKQKAGVYEVVHSPITSIKSCFMAQIFVAVVAVVAVAVVAVRVIHTLPAD